MYKGTISMKITAINTYFSREAHRNLIFVEVLTDTGISGVGEAYSVGPDDAVPAVVKQFESWLVGKDPRNIEECWQIMYNFSRFPGGLIMMAALSGIDIALWDISGKAAGVPVWRLLGGKCRNRIRTNGSVSGNTPEEMAENAKKIVEKYGFTSVKCFPLFCGQEIPLWNQRIQGAKEKMRAVRETVGPNIDVAADAHATLVNPFEAVEFAYAVAPYRPLFIEEPLRPENRDSLAEVRQKTTVPVATGEMLYSKWEFLELLSRRAADIIQPDITIAGGITEMKKIAAIAEAFNTPVAPHNPMGPIATAATIHVMATVANYFIVDYLPDDTPERLDVVDKPVPFREGWLEIPDKPGLGIELRKEGLKDPRKGGWTRPIQFHPDGTPSYI
jgi:galactonate dehydratase